MKKRRIIAAVLVVVVATGGGIYLWVAKGATTKVADPVQTAQAEVGPLKLSVSSTGKIVSNLDVEIKCKASGEVSRLPFDVSDVVKKGDLILELDPVDEDRVVRKAQVALSASQARLVIAENTLATAERTLATDRRRAEAALKSAVASANNARAKANRMKELLERKLASPEEAETYETTAIQADVDAELARVKIEELKIQEEALDQTRQQVVLARADVESDKIALDIAQQSLADTKVVAPIDGVISARNVQIGQIISSGISNVGGGTAVLTLSDLSRVFALAAVDESDIGRITENLRAVITVDAFPGKSFPGKVVQIATKGVNTSNVVTFEVKIEIESSEKGLLKPEMTANVEVVAENVEEAIQVPSECVIRRGGKTVVTVMKRDGAEERPVEVGITDGMRTQIVSGLKAGETVQVHKGGASSRWSGPPGGMMMPMGRPR